MSFFLQNNVPLAVCFTLITSQKAFSCARKPFVVACNRLSERKRICRRQPPEKFVAYCINHVRRQSKIYFAACRDKIMSVSAPSSVTTLHLLPEGEGFLMSSTFIQKTFIKTHKWQHSASYPDTLFIQKAFIWYSFGGEHGACTC